jgi:hypothetical protein
MLDVAPAAPGGNREHSSTCAAGEFRGLGAHGKVDKQPEFDFGEAWGDRRELLERAHPPGSGQSAGRFNFR